MLSRRKLHLKEYLVILYPYLSQYEIGGTGFDVGTIAIILLLFSSLVRNKRTEKSWIVFGIYCLVTTFIAISLNWMTQISTMTSFVRLGKMLVAFVFVSLSKYDLDEYTLKKAYYKVGDIATYVIFVQTILFYIFHISLRLNNGISLFSSILARPSSIFSEPSQYTNFMVVLLSLTIFQDENDFFYKNRKLLYSIGILFSTSGQGYVVLAGMWISYALYNSIIQHNIGKTIAFLLIGAAGVAIASRIPIIQASYARFFSSTSETGYSSAVTGRLVGFEYIKQLSSGQFLIGTGFGNRASGIATTGGVIYYNGISAIISGSGIIGLIIYALICINYMRESSIAYVVAIFAIWGLMISANLFYAPYIVLYYTIIKKCGVESRIA